jgi:hypothetical protein
LITFNVIKPTLNNILLENQHLITLNVIEPACANITDAGSITFDHILMTFYHIFDNNVRKRFPDMKSNTQEIPRLAAATAA